MLIKKDRNKQGWSFSEWIHSPELPGQMRIEFRIGVSRRDLLLEKGYLYRDMSLRPGTAFVGEEWDLSRPDKRRGLRLTLRLQDLPVQAVVEFKKDRLVDLEDMEQAMRIQIFQLTGSTELAPTLSEALPGPMPASSELSPGDPAALLPRGDSLPQSGSAAVPEPAQGFKPQVQVLSASVQPLEVRAGGEMKLVMQYRVEGLPDGFEYEVSEVRRIVSDNATAGEFADTVSRPVGSFTSAQTVQTPANATPGLYTFRAIVRLAGIEAEGAAFFRVIP
jgi:hypothetical protein